MKEKNPLDHLLTELGDMLQKIQEHQGPISQNLSPELLSNLDRLEKALSIFEEINQQSCQAAGIDIEQLKTEMARSTQIPDKDKTLLTRAKQIERDARTTHARYSMIAALSQQEGKRKKKETQKLKQRKKKFKPLGSNKGWIPL